MNISDQAVRTKIPKFSFDTQLDGQKKKAHFSTRVLSSIHSNQLKLSPHNAKSLQNLSFDAEKTLNHCKLHKIKRSLQKKKKSIAHRKVHTTKLTKFINKTKNFISQLSCIAIKVNPLLKIVNSEIQERSSSSPKLRPSMISLSGSSTAIDGLRSIYDISALAHKAKCDMQISKKRSLAQQLLRNYDPSLRSSRGHRHYTLLKNFASEKKINVLRSNKQIIFDRLIQIKELMITNAKFAESVLIFSSHFTSAVLPAIPFIGVTITSMQLLKSILHTGSQTNALNNLACAKAATRNPLLKTLSKHIKQERTINARKEFLSTCIGIVNITLSIMSLTGVCIPITMMIAGLLNLTYFLGVQLYDQYHEHRLSKVRRMSSFISPNNPVYLSIAKSNIGVAEMLFLHFLRYGKGLKLKECVYFLRHLGVTDNTITKLQLADEDEAKKLLQEILYNDKVRFRQFHIKQTGKTLLDLTGFPMLRKVIKNRHQWIKDQIHTSTTKEKIRISESLLQSKMINP